MTSDSKSYSTLHAIFAAKARADQQEVLARVQSLQSASATPVPESFVKLLCECWRSCYSIWVMDSIVMLNNNHACLNCTILHLSIWIRTGPLIMQARTPPFCSWSNIRRWVMNFTTTMPRGPRSRARLRTPIAAFHGISSCALPTASLRRATTFLVCWDSRSSACVYI